MTSFQWLFLLILSRQAIIDEFFRLKSVLCKKYTSTDGKDRKHTNVIDISII